MTKVGVAMTIADVVVIAFVAFIVLFTAVLKIRKRIAAKKTGAVASACSGCSGCKQASPSSRDFRFCSQKALKNL